MLGYVAVDCPANQTRRCGLEKAGDYRQIEGVIFCGGTAYAVAGCADERTRRPYTLRMPLWAAQRLDRESENGAWTASLKMAAKDSCKVCRVS